MGLASHYLLCRHTLYGSLLRLLRLHLGEEILGLMRAGYAPLAGSWPYNPSGRAQSAFTLAN